jgi:hypothetical protein
LFFACTFPHRASLVLILLKAFKNVGQGSKVDQSVGVTYKYFDCVQKASEAIQSMTSLPCLVASKGRQLQVPILLPSHSEFPVLGYTSGSHGSGCEQDCLLGCCAVVC